MAALMKISVKAEVRAMTRDLTKVQKKIVPRVTAQVLNFTGRKIKTQAVRQVSAATSIKQKIIRGRLRFGSKANPAKLILVISAWFMPVNEFKINQSPKRVAGGFVATMPSGHRGIFKRKGPPRLPIAEQSRDLNPEAEAIMVRLMTGFAIKTFLKEFDRLLSVRLKRKG